jgi:hypothetical protein
MLFFIASTALIPLAAFAQSSGDKQFTFNISHVKANLAADKIAIMKKQLTTILRAVSAAYPSISNYDFTMVALVYPTEMNTYCGSDPNNKDFSYPVACYRRDTQDIIVSSDIYLHTTEANHVIAHEMLHSVSPAFNMGTSVGLSDDGAVGWNEMLVDHFAKKIYPDDIAGYPHLTELVPDIIDILRTAKVSNPEALLEDAQIKSGYAEIDAVLNPYLTNPFSSQLATYLTTTTDTKTAAAHTYLAQVKQKIAQALTAKPTPTPKPASTPTPGTVAAGASPTPSPTPPGTSTLNHANSLQPNAGSVTSRLPATSGSDGISSFITHIYGRIFTLLTIIVGILALFMLIFQGIRMITSGGDPAKFKAARAGVVSAVIGIIVVSAAYFIVRIATSLGASVSNL